MYLPSKNENGRMSAGANVSAPRKTRGLRLALRMHTNSFFGVIMHNSSRFLVTIFWFLVFGGVITSTMLLYVILVIITAADLLYRYERTAAAQPGCQVQQLYDVERL